MSRAASNSIRGYRRATCGAFARRRPCANQKLALRLLPQTGYQADLARDGREAVNAFARQPCDVVLMDVQMPELDGLSANREITTRWAEGERPRIVAMTAQALRGDREACLAAGMVRYLVKPLRLDAPVEAPRGVQARADA